MPVHPDRSSVHALRERPQADVLIIGGGVNGLATLRDLALQGVDVALVEAVDYCSGASGASSHMIHGGIRYLENGEFRLVRESVQERNRLVKIAPHVVKPLRTVIPISTLFSGIIAAPLRMLTHRQGKPAPRGAALIKVGLMMYDIFSRDGGTLPRHRLRGPKATRAAFPDFPAKMRYSASYFDASVHEPERMSIDLLHDAIAAGARASNHVRASGFAGGKVLLRDERTGDTFDFAARVVLNASGPWTDLTNAALGERTALMGGTKGSHIMLDNPELAAATGGNEIFFENTDGRIVLIYPMNGNVMVGTTDLEADPSEPAVCTEAEVDYFFELVRLVFPRISLDRSQIVYRFSGIRPLPRHGDLAPGFVSRDYRVVSSKVGGTDVLSLVGGKLTTFRALGQSLSQRITDMLGVTRRVDTRTLPIGGGAGFPVDTTDQEQWAIRKRGALSVDRALQLLRRYGTRSADFIRFTPEERPLGAAPDYSVEELVWLVRSEQVATVCDLIQRRTNLAMSGRVSDELLIEVTGILSDELAWSTDDAARELDAARNQLHDRHGLRLVQTA
ncbi:glycerol-3-phosphate dehydrogenase/oxidase [Salinibacterium sp. ZJ454]|uniref:glycerol-3-phosphate dehydrogenase/oxidase n=1 Tax=Salinibacterium sp. ZJ454 TaxID=2708339 RepID=UPI001AB05569|nr:glycerol-3-phosphate dehydrogenase/oxidase [Salinibacterium sp. ZJ454]